MSKKQEQEHSEQHASASWWAILIPLGALIVMQSWLVWQYGADALDGASQVALLLAAGVVVAISKFGYGMNWTPFGEAIDSNIGKIGSATVILLMIGMLSGTWMVSGVVPTLICYGLKIISPKIFLFAACAISALVAIMTGSSWTTIATIGVALLGIGSALGFPVGMTAGAIISGAYFGDKVSPLSDTTVLASSSAHTPLFSHIRYMMQTTIPSISITLIAFFVLSLLHRTDGSISAESVSGILEHTFHITPWLLIVPLCTGILIALKVPAIPTLMCGALLAAVFALIFQPHLVWQIATGQPASDFSALDSTTAMRGLIESFYGPTQITTGNEQVDNLVATNGMQGMLNTIFLILSAACFGACLLASGMLQALTAKLTEHLHHRSSVVTSTVGMGILNDLVTGDQYLSIMLTCNLFRPLYERQGLKNKLLSRSVEDSATVTSVLIPWNSCGMTQAMVLNVATVVYLPYCFFNLLSPLMSIAFAIFQGRKSRPIAHPA